MRSFEFFTGRKTLLLSALLLVVTTAAACRAEKPAPVAAAAPPAKPAATPIEVDVFEVAAAAAPVQTIPAIIVADNTATVLAQRDGLLLQLPVHEGDRVSQGQELARLSQDDLQAQLRQARLEVERLKIEEQQYAAAIKTSRSELAQEEALLKDGLTSRRMFERAQARLEGAEHELEKARLATRTAEARVEAAQIELEKTIIRAPLSGTVTQIYARAGSGITRSEKLIEITQLTPLLVKFKLPQASAQVFKPNQFITVSLSDNEQQLARARVRRLAPVADAASNALNCTAELLEHPTWLPGTAVNVHLPQTAAGTVIRLPLTAFAEAVNAQTSATVFVWEAGKCAARTVTLGEIEGERVVIEAGLQPGEQVILAPPRGLKGGEPLRLRSSRPHS